MPHSDDALAGAALLRAPTIDRDSLACALIRFEGAAGLLRARSRERLDAGVPAAVDAFLRGPSGLATPAERRWLAHPRHHLLGSWDLEFPPLLRNIRDYPLALYVDGDPAALSQPLLAIVGSRNPTPQGAENAFMFAELLARRGLGITSGLALGIDTAAHRGALAAQGTTLAVVGGGVDVVYPGANRPLAEEIASVGALVSEFALSAPPRPAHFPQRNRIIAGLSLGTLIVEAARRSGSLITARAACEQGREVFAVPGSIHNPLARGCHELIKQGAKLTESVHDILSELNFSGFFAATTATGAERAARTSPAAGMDKNRKILLDALGFDPAGIDLLVVRTGLKPEAVSSIMLILELEGYVQAAPGGRYSRVARSP
jgi:DNA processing protein